MWWCTFPLVRALIGRDGELALLEDFLTSDPARKGPRALILRGEPGAGKTALLDHGHRIVSGRSFRMSAQEALSNVALAAASGMIRDLGDGIIPGIGDSSGEGSWLSPIQLFESIRRRLVHDTTILFIDDLQWLDDMSRGLIHFLVQAACTYDDDLRVVAATRPGPAAVVFMDELERARVDHTVIEVGALDEADGIELIRSLGGAMEVSAARSIWERSRGIPYWMISLVVNPEAAVPGSIVDARLRGAGDDAVRALTSLAVAGRPMDTTELASIEDWTSDRARGALDELEGRGLLRRTGSQSQIAHDLVREGVIQNLSEAALVAAHRRIVVWLERIDRPSREARLEAIGHRIAARLPATSAAVDLARSESRVLLGEDGLAVLIQVADTEAADVSVDLLIAVAALASEMGLAGVALERWSVVFHQSFDPNIRAWAAINVASAAMDLDRAAEARQWIELAKQDNPSDPAVGAESLAVEAGLAMLHEHNVEHGHRLAEEAVRLVDSIDPESPVTGVQQISHVKLKALQALHDAHMMTRSHELAAATAQRMVRAGLNPRDRLASLTNVGSTMWHLGRLEEAASVFETVWDESTRTANLPVVARVAPWYAGVLIEIGELGRAKEIAIEGSQIAERLGLTRYERFATRLYHDVSFLTDDWRVSIDRLQADILREKDPHWRLALHLLIASHLNRITPGEPARAMTEIDAAYEDALLADCKRCMTDVLVGGILIAARSGDQDRAGGWQERYRELGIEPDPNLQVNLDHAQALLSDDRADLRLAIQGYEALGRRVSGMWARLDLARAWVLEGNSSEATETYRSLAEDAASIGATTIKEVAEKGLRQLGVRTWRRTDSSESSALTQREREIAALVASGVSNLEIAEALFLSRKTVERHVSNILAKVGCRNRIELARVWGDLTLRDLPDDPNRYLT